MKFEFIQPLKLIIVNSDSTVIQAYQIFFLKVSDDLDVLGEDINFFDQYHFFRFVQFKSPIVNSNQNCFFVQDDSRYFASASDISNIFNKHILLLQYYIIEQYSVVQFIMQKLRKLIRIQQNRYRKKGVYNIIVGAILLIILLVGSYNIGKHFWPAQIQQKTYFLWSRTVMVHTASALFFFLFYILGYVCKMDQFQIRRINIGQKWHWLRENWDTRKMQTLKNVLQVHLFYVPLYSFAGYQNLKISFQFPTFTQFILQLTFGLIVQDTLFYWVHRLLHQPFFYRTIHKVHHQYDTPFSSAAQYVHPIELFVGNSLPVAAGYAMLGNKGHAFTYLYFIMIRLMNANQNHSGYEFKWSPMRVLPFNTSPTMHNFHHSKNSGAFGSWLYLWDHFMDTNDQFYRYTKEM